MGLTVWATMAPVCPGILDLEPVLEKLDEEIAKMAEAYQMEADKLKSFMGDKEKEQMKQDMAVQEAITFVVDNAVEK